MNEKEQAVFDKVPKPPEGSTFNPVRVETVAMPHPYVIGTRHVVYASAHHSGILGQAAIEAAEQHGIKCQHKGCQLRFEEHEQLLTLMVEVSQNKDLNAIPGLHAYLLKLKEANLGLDGFGFPLAA